jgi:hypothetical protein
MPILNFPSNPYNGQLYTLGNQTYQWNGSAWLRYSVNNTTVGSITVGTGSQTVVINSGTISINGNPVLTTSSLFSYLSSGTGISITSGSNSIVIASIANLQNVTDVGYTTTNRISILNTAQSTSTTTGALTLIGGAGIGGDVRVGGDLYTTNLHIADAVLDSTLILVNTTATTVVDAYPISQYRSAKYMIQIDEGMGPTANFQVIEILLLVDNVGTVYATEYGVLTSNGELGEFAAGLDIDNQVKLYFTAYQATNKELVILRTALAV